MKATIEQILDLEIEIAGAKNEKFTVVGLLNEKISMRTKYWLQKLLKKVSSEREEFNTAEKSLFESLGASEQNGKLMIMAALEDGTPNPAIKTVDEERKKLLLEEVDLGDFKFNIEDFDFESESNYYTFMSVAFE